MITEELIKNNSKLIYDCRICRVEQIEKGFLSFYFKGNDDSTIEEAEDLIFNTMNALHRTPFVAINDLRGNFGTLPEEVEKYLLHHPDLKRYKLAEALIIDSLGIRIQLNIYIKLANTKGSLIKTFNNYNAGLKWVIKKKNELIHS